MKLQKSKSQILFAIALFFGTYSFAQNYYPPTGPVAFGTPTAPTSSNFTLQLHGTTDFVETFRGGFAINHGKTSALHLTNSFTGTSISDGLLMRMSGGNLTMQNLENGSMNFRLNAVNLMLNGTTNRIYAGTTTLSTSSDLGIFNIQPTTDNGLYIRTLADGAFGLSLRSRSLTDNAIQVMGTTGTDRNFAVKANGEVFARKYTTTLNDIPDYVFSPTYELMPLSDLRTYVQANSHLPNVPSAAEYAETGVDLGEMNRILLEKVEELTLYVLELEERIGAIENTEE